MRVTFESPSGHCAILRWLAQYSTVLYRHPKNKGRPERMRHSPVPLLNRAQSCAGGGLWKIRQGVAQVYYIFGGPLTKGSVLGEYQKLYN